MPFLTIDLNNPANFAPFDGDGRKKIGPGSYWKEMRPTADAVSVTRGVARMTIEKFNEAGFIKFAPSGGLLWIIETWCYYHSMDVKIVKHPFGGWYVQQLEQEELEPTQPAFDFDDPFGDDIPRLDGRIRVAL